MDEEDKSLSPEWTALAGDPEEQTGCWDGGRRQLGHSQHRPGVTET